MIRTALAAALTLAAAAAPAQEIAQIPAQRFTLDPAHGIVQFSLDHLGLAQFVAGFDRVAATLDLDPADPAAARLEARIEVASLDLPAPPPGFREDLLGPAWFDAAAHPEITFVSDRIRLTGPASATVEGTLTLRGVSAPLALEAVFNAAYPAGMLEPHARIGFSATGTLSRSAFGMGFGVPPEGSTLGVGDLVTIRIEAEFIGTPAAQ